MSKGLKIVMAGALAMMLSAVLAHVVHPFGDAGLYAGHAGEQALMEHSSAPADVRVLLAAKCADCHSMETRVPVYGRFAPVSWLVERDVVKGRKAMNLSLWDGYSADQQQTYVAKMVAKTKAGEMPLMQYRMVHWNAGVTDADVQALQRWAHAAPADGQGAAAAGDGDAVAGKLVFEKRCTGCHALTQDREGPRLAGVYGRTAGTVKGFTYSAALAGSKIVWDEATLDKWLTDTDALVPGNNMDFRVVKAQERKDLIAYLKSSR